MPQITLIALALLFTVAGCGPLKMPMVARFDEKGQKQFDETWNKALTPVTRLDRRQCLDLIVGIQAFQAGVDKLTMRSEKEYSEGHVVMEITFDRARPERDRFVVQVFSHEGKLLRELTYQREEVEKTYRDLFENVPKEGNAQDPEAQRRRADYEARWAAIVELFPKAAEEKK